MATANTGGGTSPPPPPVNQPVSTTASMITWSIRGVLIFFLLLLLIRGCGGCNKSKQKEAQENEQDYKKIEVLVPLGEFICYPEQELILPPVNFKTGWLKIRVNGHNHYVYYPSSKSWEYRDKKIEQYNNTPRVDFQDVLKVKADTSEKELFVVYMYQADSVKVLKE